MIKINMLEEKIEELKADYGILSTKELEEKYDASYSILQKVMYKYNIINSNRKKPVKYKYLYEHIEEFKNDWILNILTKEELMLKYYCTYGTLNRLARKLNIKRKNKKDKIDSEALIFDVLNQSLTYKQLCQKYGVCEQTIRKILKEHNIKCHRTNRKYVFDDKYFDTIDNEHKAYWLGFIYADGSHNEKRHSLIINLKEEDSYILSQFYKDIKCVRSVKKYYNKQFNKYYAHVSVYSSHLSKSLLKQGIPHNKSFKIKFPSNDIVPYNLKRHFIRGYFDGDGCVSIPKNNIKTNFSIAGNYDFLKGMKEHIEENIPNFKISLNKCNHSNIYSINKGGCFIVEKFLEWLYNDSTIYLQRKHDKYLKIKKNNEVKINETLQKN